MQYALSQSNNYNTCNLTDFETCIFNKVTNISVKNVGQNIFVMTTNYADSYDENDKTALAPILETFDKMKIPYNKSFPFHSINIYKSQ